MATSISIKFMSFSLNPKRAITVPLNNKRSPEWKLKAVNQNQLLMRKLIEALKYNDVLKLPNFMWKN